MDRKLIAEVGGALLALASWLLLVPWHLSELDAEGYPIEGGGDDAFLPIALVGVAVVAAAVLVLAIRRLRPTAAAFALGGLATWSVLFAWRASVARVSGANLWTLPLLFVFLPVTVIVPRLLARLTRGT